MNSSETVRMAILATMDQMGRPAGASALAERLSGAGLRPRSVRYHLLQLDREGLTRLVSRRRGREITDRGRAMLSTVRAGRPTGDWAAREDEGIMGMQFRLKEGKGTVLCDTAMIHRSQLVRCMEDLKPVFSRKLCTGGRIAVAQEGMRLDGDDIPRHHIALGVVSSSALSGLLRLQGILFHAMGTVLLDIRDDRPVRVVERVCASHSTMDPAELLIRAGLTRVRECARSGSGLICARLLEIPAAGLDRLIEMTRVMERHGLGGSLLIGRPGQPVLDLPVEEGRVGWLVASGLNAWAAIHETGASIRMRPLAGLEEYASFRPFHEWRQRFAG